MGGTGDILLLRQRIKNGTQIEIQPSVVEV